MPNQSMEAIALEFARGAVVYGFALPVLPGVDEAAVDRVAWTRERQRAHWDSDFADHGLRHVRSEPHRAAYVVLHCPPSVVSRHGVGREGGRAPEFRRRG
jgi:hypothetical protein